jgi:hypothetical protein
LFHVGGVSLHLTSGVAVLGKCLFNNNGFSRCNVPRFGIAIAQIERVSHRWIAAVNALVEL